jgi:predicted nucleotidyltransferase
LKIHGREIVLKTLAGSANRNLNDKNSDRDLKVFVLPTFEDLYTSTVYKNFETSDVEDIEVHDIRKLEKLLYNSNLTYLELLYSVEIDTFGFNEINEIIEMRNDIVKMNLKSLFNSCFGMYKGQLRDIQKPNSELQKKIIEEYGYNTKKAMMSLHFLRFIDKFYQTDFTDFKGSIFYEGNERDFMLSIKQGKLSLDEFVSLIQEEEVKAKKIESEYFKQQVNEETNKNIQRLLRSLVLQKFI